MSASTVPLLGAEGGFGAASIGQSFEKLVARIGHWATQALSSVSDTSVKGVEHSTTAVDKGSNSSSEESIQALFNEVPGAAGGVVPLQKKVMKSPLMKDNSQVGKSKYLPDGSDNPLYYKLQKDLTPKDSYSRETIAFKRIHRQAEDAHDALYQLTKNKHLDAATLELISQTALGTPEVKKLIRGLISSLPQALQDAKEARQEALRQYQHSFFGDQQVKGEEPIGDYDPFNGGKETQIPDSFTGMMDRAPRRPEWMNQLFRNIPIHSDQVDEKFKELVEHPMMQGQQYASFSKKYHGVDDNPLYFPSRKYMTAEYHSREFMILDNLQGAFLQMVKSGELPVTVSNPQAQAIAQRLQALRSRESELDTDKAGLHYGQRFAMHSKSNAGMEHLL